MVTPQAEQQQQLAAAKAAEATKDAQIKAIEVCPACVVAVLWCLTSYNILSVNFPSFLTQLCSLYAPIFVFSLYSGQFPSPEIYNFRKMYV